MRPEKTAKKVGDPKRLAMIKICLLCKKKYHPYIGNAHAKFCSKKCSCRSQQTFEFQSMAGKVGGQHNARKRGLNTKPSSYIKENNRHQHRVVMEKVLGRKLTSKEIVHHKDENKHNNPPSNLEVMTQAEHAKYHFRKLWKDANYRKKMGARGERTLPVSNRRGKVVTKKKV